MMSDPQIFLLSPELLTKILYVASLHQFNFKEKTDFLCLVCKIHEPKRIHILSFLC